MIWIILSVGVILRLVSLNQSLWLDEAINVLAAQKYSLWGMLTEYAVADFHPPGYFFVLWLWGKLFGYSEISVRLPSVIFGVLTIYVTYLIGKNLVSRKLGFLAALLLAINPLHIYYSQEARMYAMATLAVSLNIFLLLKFIKGEKMFLLLIISNLFVLASDYIAYFIFPAQFVFFLFLKKNDLLKKWLVAFIVAVSVGVLWLPVFLNQLDTGAVASSKLPTWKFVAGGVDFKTIPLTLVKFIIGRITIADKIIYAVVSLPIVGIFAFLLWRGIKSLDRLSRKLLLCWLIIPPAVAVTVSFVVPIYNYFRVLFVLPAFVISVAMGILAFRGKLKYGLLTGVLVIEIFSSLIYLLNQKHQREDWRGLVNFLKERNKTAKILMESSGTLPPFDYYARGQLDARGALKDFPAKSENDLIDSSSLLKTPHIYLVDYLVDISDPERLVAKKITRLGYELLETKDFHGVGFLYHYVK